MLKFPALRLSQPATDMPPTPRPAGLRRAIGGNLLPAKWSVIFRQFCLLAALLLVHATLAIGGSLISGRSASAQIQTAPTSPPTVPILPASVEATRQLLLDVVASGIFADLREVADHSDLPPDTGAPPGVDYLNHLHSHSVDGAGQDLLKTIATLLSRAPGVLRTGPDHENNRLFIWPSFAFTDLSALDTDASKHLDDLVTPERAGKMKEKRTYTSWVLAIGADGVWHRFSLNLP